MTTRDLARLPKAHLHLHLEGGMRPATLADLASAHGLPTPDVTGFTDFVSFDALYQAACDVLRTPADLARLVHELAEDAAAAGCLWMEPAVWPPLHASRLGEPEAVLEILVDAARSATAATGVGIGYLIAADRNRPVAEAQELAALAARWAGRGVVAFGLHNDESRFAPEPFAAAFATARRAGLLAAPHAGELAGPASVRGPSTRSALTGCSTASAPSRTPPCSRPSPNAASASTCAPRRTWCWASSARPPSTRCRRCWPPACGAA